MPTAVLGRVARACRLVADEPATGPADAVLLGRFAATDDAEAFAVLVRRHGPMVLGVCRRVLRNAHDADDAFQAVFLLLASKARSLADPRLVAGWLHAVACRVAVRLRHDVARRRTVEARSRPPASVVDTDAECRDLRACLDEEISRLPARQRDAVVLCYLQGRPDSEVARLLDCSRGTVATLLARARQRLHRRLSGRGLTPETLLSACAPALPSALPQATAAASARAVTLAKGVAGAMLATKIKVTAACLGALMLAGLGAGWAVGPAEEKSPPIAPKPVPTVVKEEKPEDAGRRVVSANFVIEAPTAAIARVAVNAAERHRKVIAEKWFGKAQPTWEPRCRVTIKVANGEGGATTFDFDRGRVRSATMEIQGNLDRVLTSTLAHEITHVLMAHHFGKALPRWADEGIAVMSEDAASRRDHTAKLHDIYREKRAMPLAQLLPKADYPADVMVLYCQGHSLTEFLVGRKDRATFLAFLRTGMEDSWEAAAKHYAFADTNALEKAWLDRVFNRSGAINVPAPDVRLPDGPTTKPGLARIVGDSLTVAYRDSGERWPIRSTLKANRVKAFDHKGQAVGEKELTKRLADETLVFVLPAGERPDPLFLRLVREGTLLLSLPR